MWGRKRRGKFNVGKGAIYDGHLYHSKKEGNYARDLDLLLKAGEIKSYRKQVTYPLKVNGKLICKIIPDFVIIDKNGLEIVQEVKGRATDSWRIKWKLFDALYPDLKKEIIW